MVNNNIVLTGELGTIMSPGVINRNGHVYTKECFEKAMRDYNKKMIKEQRLKKLKKINEKYE